MELGSRAWRTGAREGIADDLGTAVTVQAMVFGNRGADSGTGVRVHAQSVDRRAGAVRRRPVQRAGRGRRRGHARDPNRSPCSTSGCPRSAAELRRYADVLERHLRATCATSSSRSRTAACGCSRCGSASAARGPRCGWRSTWPRTSRFLCRARRRCAASPRMLADPPRVFVRARRCADADRDGPARVAGRRQRHDRDLIRGRGERPRTPAESVILVRPETSPEDVRGMARSAGVLTARGGLASHAAVVARGWGIPAVVGASAVVIDGDEVRIGEQASARRRADQHRRQHGRGLRRRARRNAGRSAPEAATLLGWAPSWASRSTSPTPDEVQRRMRPSTAATTDAGHPR